MKKKLLKISVLLAGTLIIVFALNIKVTTRQGVNYKIRTIRIPLYLKILDFLDRHYNYAQLVRSITDGSKSGEERVMRIFRWTYENIKMAPEGMPVIDDHVWYIIVRGYGKAEQSSDVFTTLCNYSGLDAFYYWVSGHAHTDKIVLSFVKMNTGWIILDIYHGVYFKNKKGGLADIVQIKSGNYTIENIPGVGALDFDYKDYFANLPDIKDMGSSRGGIQSPPKRFIFEMKKWKGMKQK